MPPRRPLRGGGVSVRTFVLGQDDEPTVRTVRACFEDHWGHVACLFDEDLESWRHNWNTNPDFDPACRWPSPEMR